MSRHVPRKPAGARPRLETLEERVVLNAPPTLNVAPLWASEGGSSSLYLSASDPDGDSLTFSASGLPSGLAINNAGGMSGITGSLGYAVAASGQTVTLHPTVTVTDGSYTVSATFDLAVADTNRLPSPFGPSSNEGQTASLDFHGTDGTGTNALTYSASGLPHGLSINASTGLITGTLAYDVASSGVNTLTATVTLTDDHGGTDVRPVTWPVTDVPLLSSVMWSGNEGSAVSYSVPTSVGATMGLTFTASGLPSGLTINPSTGLVRGQVGYDNASALSSPNMITATLTASNASGVLEQRPASWMVGDIQLLNSASWSGPEGDSVSYTAATSAGATAGLTFSVSGLPSGLSLNASTGLVSGRPGYANASSGQTATLIATLTASDGGSVVEQRSITWNVTDQNRLPATFFPAATTEGQTASLDFHGTDGTGTNALTYSASGLPHGLSINASTGLITGTIAYDAASSGVSSLTATITLTDDHGGADIREQVIGVTDVPLVYSGGLSVPEGAAVSSSIATSVGLSLSLIFTASGLPYGLTINPSTGLVTGPIGYGNATSLSSPVSFIVTLTASDAGGPLEQRTGTWTVANTPVFSSVSWMGSEGNTVSTSVAASGTSGLTFGASGLPQGLSMDPSTGLITGRMGYGNASAGASPATLTATLTASDGSGPVESQAMAFTITDVPLFSSVSPWSGSEMNTASLSMAYSGSTGMTFSASGLPQGLAMTTAGLISGTVGYGAAASGTTASITATVTASDSYGPEETKLVTFSVADVNRLPSPTAQANAEGASVSLSMQGTDNSGTNTLDYSATDLPDGMTIDPSTGLIGGRPAYWINAAGASATFQPVVTLSDDHGGSDTRTLSWSVSDTNRLPSLATQSNLEGQAVALDAHGTDNSGTDTLSYGAAHLPLGLHIDANTGLITGQVAFNNASGGATVTFTPTLVLSDDSGGSDTKSYTWVISDNSVAANPDSYSVVHDRTLSVPKLQGVLPNDRASSGLLTAYLVTGAGHGSVSLSADGGFVYTPSAGYVGGDSFTYLATNGSATATTTVSLQVTNDAPVAHDDTIGVHYGQSLSFSGSVLANDTDADGDPLTASLVGTVGHGTLTLNANGSFVYTPSGGYTGTDSFTYSASDGVSGSTATVSLNVHSSNASPSASADSYGLLAGHPLSVPAATGVLANDTDADHDPLTASLSASVAHGTLTLNADGSFLYTPSAGYQGNDSFTYLASDGLTSTSPVTVTLNVHNRLPGLGTQSVSEGQGVSLDVHGTDSTGTNTLTYSMSGGPAGLSIDPSLGLISGTVGYSNAATGATATLSATLTLRDDHGGTDTTVFSWVVSDTNRLPTFSARAESEGQFAALSAWGSDATGTNSLTYAASNLPAGISIDPSMGLVWGTLAFSNATLSATATFTPTITLSDNHGGTDTRTFSWSVSDNTLQANDDLAIIAEDNSLSVTAAGVLGNDVATSGTLTAGLVGGPAHGTLSLSADGSFLYTPAADFNGMDSFTYSASNGLGGSSTATVTVSVTPVNDPPSITATTTLSATEDTWLSISGVSVSDVDAGGETVQLTLEVVNATLSLDESVSGGLGSADISGNGTSSVVLTGTLTAINNTLGALNGLRYRGAQDYNGTDTLTLTADDQGNSGAGRAKTASATVSLSVTPVNDAPVAVDDWYAVAESVGTVLQPQQNDTDVDGDTLTVFSNTAPAHGTLSLSVDHRSLTYTPTSGYSGPDSFTYTVADPGGLSATATVHLNVAKGQWASGLGSVSSEWPALLYEWRAVRALGVPDTFQYGDLETAWAPEPEEGGQQTIDLSFRQAVPAIGFLIRETSGNGFVTGVEFRDTSGTYHPIWSSTSLDFDNSPAGVVADFVRSLSATTSYSVDGVRITINTDRDPDEWEEIDAVELLSPASLTFSITAPTAVNDSATVAEDGTVSIQVLNNDTHPEPGYLSVPADPSHGRVYVSDNATPQNLADDYLVYTPDPDFNGTDSFTYTVTDIYGNVSSANVTASVMAVNDPPTTGSDLDVVAVPSATLTINALAGADDVDGDTLTLGLLSTANHGTASMSGGTLYYTPSAGFVGVDSFTYSVSDGHGGTATATVQAHVYGPGQWASSVISYSSQFVPDSGTDWEATQALGEPDTFEYGDAGTAWSPANADGAAQSLSPLMPLLGPGYTGAAWQTIALGFSTHAPATGLIVRETSGNGFVRGVVLIDDSGGEHTLWAGVDPSQPGDPADLTFRFPQTGYNVAAVRVVIDTDHALGEYEEIDAVRLLTGGTFSSLTVSGQIVGTAGAGTWTNTSYDAAGRPVLAETYNAAGLFQSVASAYDGTAGFLSEQTVTDVLGNQTDTTFDAAGRTLTQTAGYGSAQPSTTSYGYDVSGNLVSLTDPNNNTTTWAYDALGRETAMTDPLGKTVYQSYDAAGNVASITDRDGLRRDFSYDAESRLVEERWLASDGVTVVETITFANDADGLLESAGNSVGTYTFAYDDSGQMTSVTGPWGVTLTFGYDDAGDRTSVSDSFGGTITSAYDDAQQLASRTVSQSGQPTLRIDQDHDASGRLTEQRRYSDAAGTTLVARSDYGYDDAGHLTSLVHKDGSNNVIASYSWTYDSAGQLTSQTDHGVTTDFSYDEQGQLTEEDDGTTDTDYGYDAAGNRNTGGTTVDDGNQLETDGTWDYTYSFEGEVTKKVRISDGLAWTYGWDHRHQMTWAEERETDGGDLIFRSEFRYDPWGNRVEKKVDSDGDGVWDDVQRYVLDGWSPAKPMPVGNENFDVVMDLDGSNALETRYLRGDAVDELFGRVDAGTTPAAFWTLPDQLGSVREVIDNTGAVMASARYNAFGEMVSRTDEHGDPLAANDPGYLGRYGWTDRERDETGLQYNRARYYDPATGRWFSRDPMGFAAGDSNLYRYSGNAATNLTDPSGLKWIISRLKGDKAKAVSDDPTKDTLNDLATTIGMDPRDMASWLSLQASGKDAIPKADAQASLLLLKTREEPVSKLKFGTMTRATLPGTKSTVEFWVPNLVFAVWAGNEGKVGRGIIGWDADMKALTDKGYKLEQQGFNPKNGADGFISANTILTYMRFHTKERNLYGLYFWGHGSDDVLLTDSSLNRGVRGRTDREKQKDFTDNIEPYLLTRQAVRINTYYRLGLAILYACHSAAMVRDVGGQITFGDSATLIPVRVPLLPRGIRIGPFLTNPKRVAEILKDNKDIQ